jgi:hypothetical protein
MANSDKNIRITTSKNKTTFPNIVFTGSAAGTSVITLEVLDDNTLSFSSNEGQVFSLDANLSTGTIWSVNDISGVPLLRASAGSTVNIAEFSGGLGIGITNPSTEVYKLQVKGQVALGSTADTNNHFVFNTSSSSVNTNSFQLRRGALAQFYEDGDVFKTTFRANASQSADANYIWPVGVPATGTSVLQSDTSGNLLWVGQSAGGGGGGVNSGTAGSVAYYAATGTNVSGSNVLSIATSGTAITANAHIDIKTNNDLRLWNSGNTFYTALQSGNNTANYNLLLPTAPVGTASSVIIVASDGQMYFVAPGAGIAFSNATNNLPTIRARRSITMQFSAGYTPAAAGPDTVVLKIPDSSIDGVTDVTYLLREFDVRVETPSSGSSRIQLEKYTGTGAFTLGGTGYSMIGGFGITLTGAGTYFTSTASFAAGAFVTSNDKLRVNWTLLNATHANFTIQLTMQEV